MKRLIIKFLSKLGGVDTEDSVVIDKAILSKWLYMSYKDKGWSHYYTLRKKNLTRLLSSGIDDDKEYWRLVGALKELRALSSNINLEIKRRNKALKIQHAKNALKRKPKSSKK